MGLIQRRESISQRQAGCVQTPSRCTEQQQRQKHRGTLGLGQSGLRPLPLRQGSERVPRAALESAGGKQNRSLTFPTPSGDSDRSCNVFEGKSWGGKTCVTWSLMWGAAVAEDNFSIWLQSVCVSFTCTETQRGRGSTAEGCTHIEEVQPSYYTKKNTPSYTWSVCLSWIQTLTMTKIFQRISIGVSHN